MQGRGIRNAIPDVPFSSEGEYIYEFEVRPSGMRFYHPSHAWPGVVQNDSGLYGPVIIEPSGPEPFPYDREYTLFFDDWATGTRPPLPGTWDGSAVGGGWVRRVRGRPPGVGTGCSPPLLC